MNEPFSHRSGLLLIFVDIWKRKLDDIGINRPAPGTWRVVRQLLEKQPLVRSETQISAKIELKDPLTLAIFCAMVRYMSNEPGK
jgi:hypothetical protein